MQCPYCSAKMILPAGSGEHDYLVVGKAPGNRDISEGAPFTGLYGQIMRGEFNKAGLSFDLGTYTNLWLHKLEDHMWDEDNHLMWHRARLVEEIKQHKHVLFLGTDLARIFLQRGVSEIMGIPTTSAWFPDQITTIFLSEPMSVMHGGVGEFRLGISKFATLVEKPE